jgi:hypothetical protein
VSSAAGASEIRRRPHAKVVLTPRRRALERHPVKRATSIRRSSPARDLLHGPTRSVGAARDPTCTTFICDGSAVPGPIGANPQMTIMALSLRAAEMVQRRLERLAAA